MQRKLFGGNYSNELAMFTSRIWEYETLTVFSLYMMYVHACQDHIISVFMKKKVITVE